MRREIDPKMLLIVIGVLAVVLLGIGWKMFFTSPAQPSARDRTKLRHLLIEETNPSNSPSPTTGGR